MHLQLVVVQLLEAEIRVDHLIAWSWPFISRNVNNTFHLVRPCTGTGKHCWGLAILCALCIVQPQVQAVTRP